MLVSVTDAVLVTVAGGQALLYVGPELAESHAPELREGLVRRRLVATTGACPCGARLVVPNRAERRAALRAAAVLHVHVAHVDDCPALDPRLEALAVRP